MGGAQESHFRVQDLQHPQLSKPSCGTEILDTQMGPDSYRPSRNVVIGSVNSLS